MNQITLIGRAGDAPEIKTTQAGDTIAKLSLAVDRGKDKDPVWFSVTFFGKQADVAAAYVTKGKQLAVVGRMLCDKWTTDEGEKKTRWYVQGDRLELLGSKGDTANGNASGEPSEEELPF